MITERTPIERLGTVVRSDGDLYTNVQDLGGLISPRDEAYVRIHSDIGRIDGTRVSMSVNYLRGENPVWVRNGITRGLAKNLVGVSFQNKFFSTGSAKQYETARKVADKQVAEGVSPEKRKAIVCPSRRVFSMSPTENPNHLAFVFQDLAQAYFNRNEQPIQFYPIDENVVDGNRPELLTDTPGTIPNYIWFRALVDMSELIGGYLRADGINNRARGVDRRVVVDAEGIAKKSEQEVYPTKKFVRGYSPGEIKWALKELRFEGLGKQLIEKLSERR